MVAAFGEADEPVEGGGTAAEVVRLLLRAWREREADVSPLRYLAANILPLEEAILGEALEEIWKIVRIGLRGCDRRSIRLSCLRRFGS